MLKIELLACLFKEIAHIVLLLEIAHTLATNNTFVPMTRHKLIKAVEIERFAAIIDKSSYTILITVIVAMTVWIITLVIVIMTMAVRIITFMAL